MNIELDKKFAVLIDLDNVSHKYIKNIFEELSSVGKTPIRRVYGDFTNFSNWKDVCLEYSIKQVQQFNYTKGKNASDSTLIIDAMDILYKEEYLNGFVIVSSDSDFTGLCMRLREANKEVIGIGNKETVEALRKACTSFKYLENISDEAFEVSKDMNETDEVIIKIKEIVSLRGKILISQLKEQILELYNDFDEKNYGYNQMRKFISSIEGLKVEVANDKTTLFAVSKIQQLENDLKIENKIIEIIFKEKNKKINIGQLQTKLKNEGINYKDYGFSKFIKFLSSMKNLKITNLNVEIKSTNQ